MMTTETISCSGCDARWKGLRTAHCGGCHETFSGVTLFDAHRRGGRCHDPSAITVRGQQIIRRDTNVWHLPAMPAAEIARRRNLTP